MVKWIFFREFSGIVVICWFQLQLWFLKEIIYVVVGCICYLLELGFVLEFWGFIGLEQQLC